MRKVLTKILAFILAFMLTGCSNTPDDEPESRFNVYSFIDFGLTLQDTLIQAYTSDLNLTTELVEDTYLMMDSFEKVADSVITSSTLAGEFIDLLAKEQTFNTDYDAIFSRNTSYGTDTPYFTMYPSIDTNTSYFLVSSSTRLFVPGTTIKTIFSDNTSLTTAWQRSLDHHQSGNMYLNIYEIKLDGTVQRAGTPAVIPGSTITTF